jgi:hypothetical protein
MVVVDELQPVRQVGHTRVPVTVTVGVEGQRVSLHGTLSVVSSRSMQSGADEQNMGIIGQCTMIYQSRTDENEVKIYQCRYMGFQRCMKSSQEMARGLSTALGRLEHVGCIAVNDSIRIC